MRSPALAAVAALAVALAAPAAAGGATVSVGIADTAYTPPDLRISPGDTVSWRWNGPDTDHSVTADPGQAESFDTDPHSFSINHPVGFTFTHTFTHLGRFTYFCRVHEGMVGTVTVRIPDTTPPRLTRLRARPARFCARGVRHCRHPGTKLTFRLSEQATVRVAIRRGRRTVKRLRKSLRAGARSIAFSGRGLHAGLYRAVLRATDLDGNRSAAVSVRFRVVRP